MTSDWAKSASASPDWATTGLDLHLETHSGGGRRVGLEEALREAIVDGRLPAGERVPPSRSFAVELGVARGTVTAAYQQLVAEGYLTARRGAGTRVAELTATTLSRHPTRAVSTRPPIRHDLMVGRPDTAAFPRREWLRATRKVLAELPSSELTPSGRIGTRALREALVGYLGRTRGVRTQPDRIIITTGFQQSLSLLTQCVAPGRTVAMEDPCMDFHRAVVRRAGRQVSPLPVDGSGAAAQVPPEAGAAVVTPAHQAVLGTVMAPDRRRALVDWAGDGGGLLIEDDYDGEFRYDQQPVGALQAMAPEHVACVGSTSKTIMPGLRLGWIVLPKHLVEPVSEAKFLSDGATEVLGQHVLAEFITSHAHDRHIRTQRSRYRSRRDQLVTGVRRVAPEVRIHGAAAGVQLFLELPPDGPSAAQVERAAAARGIRIAAGDRLWHASDHEGPGSPRQMVGVGYGTPAEHGFAAALEAFLDVLRDSLADSDAVQTG